MKPTTLFRPQALAGSGPAWGAVLQSRHPAVARVLMVGMGLWAVVAGAASQWSWSRTVSAPGVLVPAAGLHTLPAARPARLQQWLVAPGDWVEAGQVLARLEDPLPEPSGGRVAAQRAALAQRMASLQRDLQVQQQRHRHHQQWLAQQLGHAEEALRGRQHELQLWVQRQEAAEQEWGRHQRLFDEGFLSAAARDQARLGPLDSRLRALSAQRAVDDAHTQWQLARRQQEQAPQEWALQDNTLQRELDSLRQQDQELQAQQDWSVRAPVSGHVWALHASAGAVVERQQALLDLWPARSASAPQWQVQLRVPSAVVGWVGPGQAARLELAGFPATDHGWLQGTVLKVSASAQPAVASVHPAAQAYAVLLDVPPEAVARFMPHARMKAGMAVQAHLQVERRTLWQWLWPKAWHADFPNVSGGPTVR